VASYSHIISSLPNELQVELLELLLLRPSPPLLRELEGFLHFNTETLVFENINCEGIFEKVAQCCPNLSRLNAECGRLTGAQLKAILTNCSALQFLNIAQNPLTTTEMQACLPLMTNLKYLVLSDLPVTPKEIGTFLPSLLTLDISLTRIDDKYFDAVTSEINSVQYPICISELYPSNWS